MLFRSPDVDLSGALTDLTRRQSLMRAWASWFGEFDAVVSPIWTRPAFEHGFDISSPTASAETLDLLRPVMPANYLGLPAAAVSAGMADGLPVAVQVIGPAFSDLRCLTLAEQIDDALGLKTPITPAL